MTTRKALFPGWISVIIFYIVTLFFTLISIVLLCFAALRLWATITTLPNIVLNTVFESIGFTTVAAAVFELARTMYQEEIVSKVDMDEPRKIRHFISRFMTVIIISLSIEFLTMVFRFSHEPHEFPYLFESAAVAIGIALVFAAWAFYSRMSVHTEKWERELSSARSGQER